MFPVQEFCSKKLRFKAAIKYNPHLTDVLHIFSSRERIPSFPGINCLETLV